VAFCQFRHERITRKDALPPVKIKHRRALARLMPLEAEIANLKKMLLHVRQPSRHFIRSRENLVKVQTRWADAKWRPLITDGYRQNPFKAPQKRAQAVVLSFFSM
jgi:hypothetical protein